ncbi:MAG: cobalamin biosynthesis protein CobD [Thiotrichales bacterium]|nr:cobalamin biosynthesis protein CobD [Thiotrichales bacterium]
MSSYGFEFHIVLAAMAVDAVVGDPPWLYKRVPHPVVVMGSAIEFLERMLNRAHSTAWRYVAGGLCFVLVTSSALLAAMVIDRVLIEPYELGWLLEAVIASTLLAFRSLYDHVRRVADGLGSSLEEARAAVSHVVGRDPDSLDESGAARAAIESVAENFSDAVVVPVFWYVIAGLPGLFVYKAINTLDSMIGHQSERQAAFGFVSAKVDDLVNLIPARIAGLYFVAAASIMPGASGVRALRVMWRDASKHRSPNAGWQEAAVAGALDLALAGPRIYPDEIVDDAWMGDGESQIGKQAVHASLRLYLIAGALVAVTLLVLAWLS